MQGCHGLAVANSGVATKQGRKRATLGSHVVSFHMFVFGIISHVCVHRFVEDHTVKCVVGSDPIYQRGAPEGFYGYSRRQTTIDSAYVSGAWQSSTTHLDIC